MKVEIIKLHSSYVKENIFYIGEVVDIKKNGAHYSVPSNNGQIYSSKDMCTVISQKTSLTDIFKKIK